MSTAVLDRAPAVEVPPQIAVKEMAPALKAEKAAPADPCPLLPVFLGMGVSFIASGLFVGWILVWISIRYSGVMAP